MDIAQHAHAQANPAYKEMALTMAFTAVVFGVGTGFTTWLMLAITG